MQNRNLVAFSSRALTDVETRYHVIDKACKEMSALCFAVSKYRNHIYGHNVTVYTDHKTIGSHYE